MSTLGVGSFLQGLLSGYKTADDMRLKQEELNLTKVKLEQAKDEEKRKKDKDTLELQMKVEEQDAKRIKELNESFESDSVKDINYAVGSYNSKASKFGIDSRKAVMTDQDGKQYVTDFTKDTIDGYADIQASLSNKDGMYIFKNNYLHSKNPDTGEYVRTNNFGQSVENIKEAYRIKQAGTGTETLADGTIATKAEALGQKAQDKRQSTTVNVMGEEKPIEVSDQFGTFYANKNTAQPITDSNGKKVYKTMNDKTYKIIEGLDQSKQTISALNNMVKIIDKDPKAIGSIGSDPLNYIANQANDILGIPTPSNVNRNTIGGQGGVLAAMTRKLYENGVMTEPDYQRYMKNVPAVNDSDEVFRNKAKIMVTDLSSKVKQTEDRYGSSLPDFVKQNTSSAIAPYEEPKKQPKLKQEVKQQEVSKPIGNREGAMDFLKSKYPNKSIEELNKILDSKGY